MQNVQRVLITGGAGFIGSSLAEVLLRRKIEVIIVDNMNDFYDPGIKEQNLAEILQTALDVGGELSICKGDICDNSFLTTVFLKYHPDMVVHLAAYAGVRPSIQNPMLYSRVNIEGTASLLEVMRKFEIRYFVFASSSSVYGNKNSIPFRESDSVNCPVSPYAATKRAGELLAYTYHSLYGINIACLRFFTVYGPRQRSDLAIHKFMRCILNSQPIPFYGDGQTGRDYTYIDDIIDGVTKAMEWVDSSESRYEIFNLGESRVVTLKQMVEEIERCTGIRASLNRLPKQPGDMEQTCADISKAERLLGYHPCQSFEDGIEKFVEWYHNHQG